MKNLSNVQKKENLNKEATKANEVTLIGNNVELLFTNKRYSALKNLFEEMENNLKTPLNFNVNVSCVMLEAFAKGIIEDDGLVELFQTNMAPKSFFCFVNDLSLARKHTSSREIINIYFTEKVIKKLALEKGDIVLSGHTHVSGIFKKDSGIININPGSITIPKGGTKAGFAVIEEERIDLYDLEGEVIATYKF